MLNKWRPPDTQRVNTATIAELYASDDDRLRTVFRTGGLLSQKWPGFRPRPQQNRLAQQSLRALNLRKILIAEAGTGTGKSLAAIVAAVEHAKRNQRTVLISTATNVLLDQYRLKDLPDAKDILDPFLIEKYGSGLNWATVKGRANYYCQARGVQGDFVFQQEVEEVYSWLQQTQTGDLSELSFDVQQPRYRPLRQSLTADSDECPGAKRCPLSDTCYFYSAKREAEGADIILTNHALLCHDLAYDGALLPGYGAAIIDEAHKLQQYVYGAAQQVIDQTKLRNQLGLASKMGIAVAEAGKAGLEFFSSLRLMCRIIDDEDDRMRVGVPSARFLDLRDSMARELFKVVADMETRLESLPPHANTTLQAINAQRLAIQDFHPERTGWICWANLQEDDRVSVTSQPIEAGDWLHTRLWSRTPSVLMSATLATGSPQEPFQFLKSELGIQGVPWEIVVESPFDWKQQALYLFPGGDYLTPSDVKSRNSESQDAFADRWTRKAWPILEKCLSFSQGRAFVLCTSKKVARAWHRRHLEAKLPWPAMVPGQDDTSNAMALEWFKSTKNPVLYGFGSWWEGVDIQSDQLSCVVIDRIPYPNTVADPVEKARAARYSDGFREYSIPLATMHLKQGLGRGLRHESKRVQLVLLDPRFRHMPTIGRLIAGALPGGALDALNDAIEGRSVSVTDWWAHG